MVAVSIVLNRIFYPTPYQFGRMLEYIGLALVIYFVSESVEVGNIVVRYALSTTLILLYAGYAAWREKIDLKSFVKHILRRGRR